MTKDADQKYYWIGLDLMRILKIITLNSLCGFKMILSWNPKP